LPTVAIPRDGAVPAQLSDDTQAALEDENPTPVLITARPAASSSTPGFVDPDHADGNEEERPSNRGGTRQERHQRPKIRPTRINVGITATPSGPSYG
jgi:hypothetical protein